VTDETPAAETTPRWVKVFGLVAVVVILLFVVVLVVSGPGGHGPGRHSPAADTAPAVDTARHQPPAGGHLLP
jgi:hypothetical protein